MGSASTYSWFCTFQAWWNFYNCLSFIINKMRGNFTCCLVNVIDNGTQQLFVRYGVYFMELWKEKLKIIVQILCLNRLCEHGLTYAGLGNAVCRVPWWQLYHPECLSVSNYLMVRPNPSTCNSIVFFCVFFFFLMPTYWLLQDSKLKNQPAFLWIVCLYDTTRKTPIWFRELNCTKLPQAIVKILVSKQWP